MTKVLEIANDLTSFEDKYSSGTISGSDITTSNVTTSNVTISGSNKIDFTSTHHTFTLKPIDETVGSDTQSGQFAVYNGATKLWGINESGWVQNPKNPMCVLFDYDNTQLTSNVTTYPFNGIAIDTNNNYDISDVNNPKFFAPIDGYYYVSVNSRFYYDFNGRADGNILINDVGRIQIYFDYFAGAASQDFQQVTGNTIVKMSAGDYLKIGVTVNSGTNHLGWSAPSYTIGETDYIGNSCSHANIFLIG